VFDKISRLLDYRATSRERNLPVKTKAAFVALLPIMTAVMLEPITGFSQEMPAELPAYLRDRGTGMPMSQLGTYVRKGELLL